MSLLGAATTQGAVPGLSGSVVSTVGQSQPGQPHAPHAADFKTVAAAAFLGL